MEDTLRSIKGVRLYGSVNYSDLCIFPSARYPDTFQVLDFEKYNGSGDPYTHLKVYIGELGSYAKALRILLDAIIDEDEWIRDKYDQLSIIDEKRMTVVFHG